MIFNYKLKINLIFIFLLILLCLDNIDFINILIKKLIFKETYQLKIEANSVFQLQLYRRAHFKSNLKYMSNHPEIIKVDNRGKISAIRPGSAIITLSEFNCKKAQIKVLSIVRKGLINNNTLNLYNASQFQNVMIVAHPDDEILWGGANLIRDRYFIVCLTNGYNLVRSNEFNQILKFTKNNGIILDYPDAQDDIIDDWSEVRVGMLKDLTTILNYKDWIKIVTYGKDGTYGHIHHKKTYKYVTQIAKTVKKYNFLYYFGKYYNKHQIPKNLTRISDKELEYKIKAIDIYKSEKKGIYENWFHALPYENWILASKG